MLAVPRLDNQVTRSCSRATLLQDAGARLDAVARRNQITRIFSRMKQPEGP